MPRFSSKDMDHNHYLDEAKKKTKERDRNSKTSLIPPARFQSTADGSKPKPRSNNQTPRSLPDKSFSRNKTSAVYEKTSPRSDLSKVDSEPTHSSNVDIPNIHESKQTMDLSAGTSINVQKEQSHDLSADSTSSTSTLATSVTADGNFDL
ncbi:hypothetical protein Tco_0368054 [Tanacetum coccineum]